MTPEHPHLPTDRAWLALLNHREPGPNMLAIARVRSVRTALDATGMRMPDDDGVMRCVVCLQPATERQTAMVTGYELLCCGQEWRAERARMGAEGVGQSMPTRHPPQPPTAPPSFTVYTLDTAHEFEQLRLLTRAYRNEEAKRLRAERMRR